MLSVGHCSVARLQMKVGHMDGMHCFIDSTSILVKIKSVSLYNCWIMYVKVLVHTNIFHLKSEHVSVNMLISDNQFIVNIKSQHAKKMPVLGQGTIFI